MVVEGGRSKGTLGPLGYPKLLSPICDDMKENEKPRKKYLTKTMEIANDDI